MLLSGPQAGWNPCTTIRRYTQSERPPGHQSCLPEEPHGGLENAVAQRGQLGGALALLLQVVQVRPAEGAAEAVDVEIGVIVPRLVERADVASAGALSRCEEDEFDREIYGLFGIPLDITPRAVTLGRIKAAAQIPWMTRAQPGT